VTPLSFWLCVWITCSLATYFLWYRHDSGYDLEISHQEKNKSFYIRFIAPIIICGMIGFFISFPVHILFMTL